MITITPLGQKAASDTSSDASSSSSSSPSPRALAYLVQIDSAYILLDCGAPEDLRFPTTSSSPSSEDGDADISRYVSEHGTLDTQALSLLPLDVAISHIAPRIQLVLLSHSTMHNVGLYAYARARLGLTCPAYATLPTASMARLVTLEASLTLASECDVAALEKRPTKVQLAARVAGEASAGIKKEDGANEDDEDIKMLSSPTSSSSQRDRCIPLRHEIDEAFESIRTLRYLQPTVLEGSLSSLSLTAHSAGHTLGGTVWKLRSPTSGTVVLAIDWNHVRERHIDGSGVIEGAAAVAGAGANAALPTATRAGEEAAGTKRAELLVTSGARLGRVNARRKDKDKSLLDLIHHTLTVSKSTLHLPLDASPRLLEILLLLDKHWAYAYPNARFPLCLVSRTGKEVIERARTMREWMGKGAQAEEANATGTRGGRGAVENHGPLELRFLRIFTSLTALSAAVPPEAAKVVITVGPSLLYGPSLRFFRHHVAGSRENTVVLTTERDVERGSPAEELRRWWQAGQEEGWTERDVGRAVSGDGRRLGAGGALEVRERRALEGRELEEFREKEREKKEREERKRAMVQRSRKRLEADQDEDEEDADDDDEEEDSSADEDEDGLDPTLPPRKRGANAVIDSEAGGSALKKKRGDASGQVKDDGTAAANDDVDLLLSHDVYLRGSAARTAVNFFSGSGSGSTSTQQQQQQHQRRHRTSVITAAQREREARERHGVGARFRSFPVIERRRRIDAFGEVIDVARWLSRGRKEEEERLRSEAAAANGGSVQLGASGTPLVLTTASSRDRGLIDQREQEEDELGGAPSKFVHLRDVDVRVHCRVHFLDLDGLIDGRALQIVLPQLAPRRLVLVDAPQPQPMEVLDADATSWWENPKGVETVTSRFVTSLLSLRDFTRDVFAPGLGCTVRVGGQVQSFDVKLGEGVLEGVEMGTYEEWALGWVEGRVVRSADEEGKGLVVLERRTGGGGALSAEDEEDDAEVAEAAKEVAEAASQHPDRLTFSPHLTRPPSTLFIGSVRLSTLKSLLSTPSHGNPRIPAEFGGAGTLVCGSAALANVLGGNVGAQTAGQASAACTVEKSGETITVEGNAGRTFVRVREAVYALHARVGGGVGRRGGI